MADDTLEIRVAGARELSLAYADLPATVGSTIARLLRQVGAAMVSYVVREKLRAAKYDPNGGHLGDGQLHWRTGALSRAMRYYIQTEGQDAAVLHVGPALQAARHARILELGGTIIGVKRKLTIPLPAARTGNGVTRFTAREVIASPSSYGFEDTFFRKGVLFGTAPRYRSAKIDGHRVRVAVGGFSEVTPLFVLKSSVTLQPTGYLAHSLQEQREKIVGSLVTGTVQIVQNAGRGRYRAAA